MPRPQGDTSAAALLGAWTDSDTAMQIVGTSFGIFGPDLLDPELALSSETPLRNALFDVLLSLVEGGAIDMRPTDDGLVRVSLAIRLRRSRPVARNVDRHRPRPTLAVPGRARGDATRTRRRDPRAKVAEALAEERERLLRLNDVPAPAPRAAKARAPARCAPALDEQEQSILDVLYASQEPGSKPGPVEIDIRERETEIVAVDLVTIEVESVEIETVEAESIAAVVPQAPVSVAKPRAKAKAKPKATAAKATPAKATVAAEADTPAKPAPAKATKPRAATVTKATKPKATRPKAAESESSDVVYLTPPAPDAHADDRRDRPRERPHRRRREAASGEVVGLHARQAADAPVERRSDRRRRLTFHRRGYGPAGVGGTRYDKIRVVTTAFVLSGGASHGAVQVGMLQALAERQHAPRPRVRCIGGGAQRGMGRRRPDARRVSTTSPASGSRCALVTCSRCVRSPACSASSAGATPSCRRRGCGR